MTTYVKKKGSDTWHWCTSCSNYPRGEIEIRYSRPASGELCNQCLSKEKKGNCR